jgi:hypothetical protein
LPRVKEENLAKRVDIFIEKSAFQPEESRKFLEKAKERVLKSLFTQINLPQEVLELLWKLVLFQQTI